MTTDALSRLQGLLSELFQFNSKELDFGIYRIMNHKRARISTSYPSPLARGYRSLMRTTDPRDLYRDQLRFAENILAFLASVALALLKKEDRTKAGIDLKRLWSGGISPGDWREIIQRCSKVFTGYRNAPLAEAIQRLKIGTQQKGFGLDVYELIKAKNDYKHDRGPTKLEDIANASAEAQERLRRCMEALSFFTDYQVCQVEGMDRIGDGFSVRYLRYVGERHDLPLEEVVLRERPYEKGLFLDLGAENRLPLYPFLISRASSASEVRETYFVDAWNTRKGVARLKTSITGTRFSMKRWLRRWLGGRKTIESSRYAGALGLRQRFVRFWYTTRR